MTKTGDAQNPRWKRAFQSGEHYRDIMWTDLVEDIARDHWEEVTLDPSSRTRTQRQQEELARGVYDTGACMVAVLFVPSNSGAYFFVSTVPKSFQSEMRRNGYLDAPAWWAAVNRNSNVYCHAEDGVEYDFEKAFRSGALRGLSHIRIVPNGRTHYYEVQDRDTEFSRLKLGVWGCYGDESRAEQKEGRFIELCQQGSKSPSCRDVATTLNIEYCTQAKLDREKAAVAASDRHNRAATRGGQGGGRGGGGGPSSDRYSSHGHSGTSAGPHSSLPPGNIRPSAAGGPRDPRGPDVSQLSGKMSSLNVRREPERRESRREPERRETRREPERRETRREPERRETRREPERRETRREPERREKSGRDEYWTWDPREKKFFHMHRDGNVSWSTSGR